MMIKEDGMITGKHHVVAQQCHVHDHPEKDENNNNVVVKTKSISRGGNKGKVPKRIVEKESSLGSVMSAITLETGLLASSGDFGNLSCDSSFSISTRSLSSSKRFEVTLSPTLEVLGSSSDVTGGGGSSTTVGGKSESRFDASPLKFDSSFSKRPMCLPERKPSEGSLVCGKGKRRQNLLRGKKGDQQQQQIQPTPQQKRCSSPPRLMISSSIETAAANNTASCCAATSSSSELPLRCPQRKPSGGVMSKVVRDRRRRKKKLDSLNDVIDLNSSNHSSPRKPQRIPSDRFMKGVTINGGGSSSSSDHNNMMTTTTTIPPPPASRQLQRQEHQRSLSPQTAVA